MASFGVCFSLIKVHNGQFQGMVSSNKNSKWPVSGRVFSNKDSKWPVSGRGFF